MIAPRILQKLAAAHKDDADKLTLRRVHALGAALSASSMGSLIAQLLADGCQRCPRQQRPRARNSVYGHFGA